MGVRGAGPRQAGRRRPIPRCMTHGKYFGMGPQAEDAVSGWYFPKKLMVKQRGRLVSARLADESLDMPQEW